MIMRRAAFLFNNPHNNQKRNSKWARFAQLNLLIHIKIVTYTLVYHFKIYELNMFNLFCFYEQDKQIKLLETVNVVE